MIKTIKEQWLFFKQIKINIVFQVLFPFQDEIYINNYNKQNAKSKFIDSC